MEKEHFKVAIRLKSSASQEFLTIKGNSVRLYGISEYEYDRVLEDGCTNADAFNFIVSNIDLCFKGVNLSVLAYGEKLSGKTFTMFGDSLSLGLVPLTVSYIFNHSFKDNYTYSCSMIAVLQDKIIDLLQENPEAYKLKIKREANRSIVVENLAEIIVEKEGDCYFLIKRGLSLKKSKKLQCDILFQISIESLKADNKGNLTTAKINFCDLLCEKSNKNFQSLNSVFACLSNNVSAPYKDSYLTKLLSDTLNKTSNAVLFASIIPSEYSMNTLISILSTASTFRSIQTVPQKNKYLANNFQVLKKLHSDISRLKSLLAAKQGGKNLHSEVVMMKKETEKLKEMLNEQSTVEEVEELIKQNKGLRIQLQNLVGRPVADNDVELPDSVSVLQKALVMTEDMIKKKKILLADQEMKAKLVSNNRCTVCTLKLPCKHKKSYSVSSDFQSLSPIKKSESNTQQSFHKIRKDYYSSREERSKTPALNEKFVENTERKIKVLSKIEAYREEKVMREIERVEMENKMQQELIEKTKADEEKRQRYLKKNKEKLKEYLMMKEKKKKMEKKKEKKGAKILKKRPQSSIKIQDYEQRKRSISKILRAQSKKFIIKKHTSRTNSISYIDSSYESMYK